jgi:hypothetical protein
LQGAGLTGKQGRQDSAAAWAELRWKQVSGLLQPDNWITQERLLAGTQNPAVPKDFVDCVIWDDEAKPWFTVPGNQLMLGDK